MGLLVFHPYRGRQLIHRSNSFLGSTSFLPGLGVSVSQALLADVFVVLRAILWERCYSYSHQPWRELRPRAPLFVTWG